MAKLSDIPLALICDLHGKKGFVPVVHPRNKDLEAVHHEKSRVSIRLFKTPEDAARAVEAAGGFLKGMLEYEVIITPIEKHTGQRYIAGLKEAVKPPPPKPAKERIRRKRGKPARKVPPPKPAKKRAGKAAAAVKPKEKPRRVTANLIVRQLAEYMRTSHPELKITQVPYKKLEDPGLRYNINVVSPKSKRTKTWTPIEEMMVKFLQDTFNKTYTVYRPNSKQLTLIRKYE